MAVGLCHKTLVLLVYVHRRIKLIRPCCNTCMPVSPCNSLVTGSRKFQLTNVSVLMPSFHDIGGPRVALVNTSIEVRVRHGNGLYATPAAELCCGLGLQHIHAIPEDVASTCRGS